MLKRLRATTTALAVGGCSGPLSTLDPAGPAATSIATLWWAMLAGSVVLTLLVLTLLALAFVRGPRRAPGGTSLWIGWLGVAMPTTVVMVLLGFALALGEQTIARSMAGVVVVEARAHQWYWDFRHAGAEGEIVTRNVLHIPAGRPVNVRLEAADVIHSFWVPRLAGKMDAIPGHVNVLRIEASQPGVFEGQCAEFCGLDHAEHRFRVIAHDEAGWAAFQRGDQP
ncbi:cytochrome c oxidase subunit II [Roseomonas marmotae]|uniref:Cytochrome aa3 subunit 2 n=1 Tax=Roseomonas marmotae TaxID=2768161 RepID=A0ABS3KI50_9PROT|nr:cytochrome c oxidase subunit II [Roseomonas marmotae]MBO1077153.1 cytochrome c oxidase subunit II [Roseomonas marmotae]QTI81818.1 cytochrome c oxidase subunit II [Roseomonas marmotae]